MLKIDNKYVKKYIGPEIPSASIVTPCKSCRTYLFFNNRFICVETKGSEGIFENAITKTLDQYDVKYQKYENSKHNVYVGTINYFL
jgi:hypothetical protein